MKYLLDTNVLREIARSTPHANVDAWLATVDDADLAISALSVREIAKGIEKLRRTKPEVAATVAAVAETIFDAFEGRILPIDHSAAMIWGQFLATSEKHVEDAGLAATAIVHGLTVVTRNVRDFDRRGVSLLDPFRSPPHVRGA